MTHNLENLSIVCSINRNSIILLKYEKKIYDIIEKKSYLFDEWFKQILRDNLLSCLKEISIPCIQEMNLRKLYEIHDLAVNISFEKFDKILSEYIVILTDIKYYSNCDSFQIAKDLNLFLQNYHKTYKINLCSYIRSRKINMKKNLILLRKI